MTETESTISRRTWLYAVGLGAGTAWYLLPTDSSSTGQAPIDAYPTDSGTPTTTWLDHFRIEDFEAAATTVGEPIRVSFDVHQRSGAETAFAATLQYFDVVRDILREEYLVHTEVPPDGTTVSTAEYAPQQPGTYTVGFKDMLEHGVNVEVSDE